MSEITKGYKLKSRIFFWLGILLTFLPLIVFGIAGCINGNIDINNKLKLGVAFAFAILLTVMGVKSKYNCRSITYILLFGCYFVVNQIWVVIFTAGVCTVLDEFICSPLHKYYHEKAVINKEIDKRYDVQQREE